MPPPPPSSCLWERMPPLPPLPLPPPPVSYAYGLSFFFQRMYMRTDDLNFPDLSLLFSADPDEEHNDTGPSFGRSGLPAGSNTAGGPQPNLDSRSVSTIPSLPPMLSPLHIPHSPMSYLALREARLEVMDRYPRQPRFHMSSLVAHQQHTTDQSLTFPFHRSRVPVH